MLKLAETGSIQPRPVPEKGVGMLAPAFQIQSNLTPPAAAGPPVDPAACQGGFSRALRRELQAGAARMAGTDPQPRTPQQPPVVKGRRAKIYYITQTGVHPPSFVAWVNDPRRLPVSYRRYLDHQLRARYPYRGTPLRLIFRQRKGFKSSGKRRRRR